MSITILGFALGILSALFFGLYMVPQKLVKIDNSTFLLSMGFGVLFTSLLAYGLALALGLAHYHHQLVPKLYGVICGTVWGLGTLSFAASIGRIGMTLATPIKNTTGILGTLVGLIIFHEWQTTNPWLGVGGSLLIVVSAILISATNDKNAPRRHSAIGVIYALLAACCYASYLVPMKLAVKMVGYWEFTPWMALGILLTTTLAVVLRADGRRDFVSYPWRVYGLSMLGGASWTIALITMSASMNMIDLSVAWALAQLNTIPAVFLGSLVFHEIHFATHRRLIYLGLLAATIGTFLLGWAKQYQR